MHTITENKKGYFLKQNNTPIKVRKNWGNLKPNTRVHTNGKKQGYNRNHQNWQTENE